MNNSKILWSARQQHVIESSKVDKEKGSKERERNERVRTTIGWATTTVVLQVVVIAEAVIVVVVVVVVAVVEVVVVEWEEEEGKESLAQLAIQRVCVLSPLNASQWKNGQRWPPYSMFVFMSMPLLMFVLFVHPMHRHCFLVLPLFSFGRWGRRRRQRRSACVRVCMDTWANYQRYPLHTKTQQKIQQKTQASKAKQSKARGNMVYFLVVSFSFLLFSVDAWHAWRVYVYPPQASSFSTWCILTLTELTCPSHNKSN